MPSLNAITAKQLARLVGTPNAPVLIDLRIDEDYELTPQSLPCAFRHSFKDIEILAPALQNKKAVTICHKGKKISQGGAALLRYAGVDAQFLQGGTVAWHEAGLPIVDTNKLSNRDTQGRSIWITHHRPKIDRIACPWLIRRFVDPSAVFLYVEPAEVNDAAERFNAAPFDIEGVHYSHRGEQCTFDTMLDEFGLESPVLHRLATIIRGADTGQHELAPQAAGLLAVSLGLSRMYKDDLAQLDASMALYDGLYRWCRDATDEKHDWPMHQNNTGGKA